MLAAIISHTRPIITLPTPSDATPGVPLSVIGLVEAVTARIIRMTTMIVSLKISSALRLNYLKGLIMATNKICSTHKTTASHSLTAMDTAKPLKMNTSASLLMKKR